MIAGPFGLSEYSVHWLVILGGSAVVVAITTVWTWALVLLVRHYNSRQVERALAQRDRATRRANQLADVLRFVVDEGHWKPSPRSIEAEAVRDRQRESPLRIVHGRRMRRLTPCRDCPHELARAAA